MSLNSKRKPGSKDRIKEKAHHLIDTAQALKVIFREVPETDVDQEIFLPAFDTPIDPDRNIALLADNTAEASFLFPSSDVCEGVG